VALPDIQMPVSIVKKRYCKMKPFLMKSPLVCFAVWLNVIITISGGYAKSSESTDLVDYVDPWIKIKRQTNYKGKTLLVGLWLVNLLYGEGEIIGTVG
jgi:hypothetical protein